jgi:hypothetical protein
MAKQKITNKFTLEKMKKKNEKSIRVNKETGEITQGGKTFKNKQEFKNREKKKPVNILEGRIAKEKRAAKSSIEQGKRNQAATSKMYAAESMFKADRAKKAAIRDTAKVKSSDRTFKSTFDAATKAGKSDFTYGGRKFLTDKGKAENRDTKKTRIAPKGSIKKPAKKLDADTVASYKKRIKYMKDRKAKGKNYSAKNLKELEAKLAANQ